MTATVLVITAAALVLSGAFAPGAEAEVLVNQIDVTSPQSTPSQDFEPSNDQFDSLAADDFTVPAGQVWDLETALIRANNSGATTTSTVNVTIFANSGGLPGATVFSGQVVAPGYPDFTLPLTAVPSLPAGIYWLGVQAVLNGGGPADPQQWFWAESDNPQVGNPAVFRNPGGGFAPSCPTFAVRSTCLAGHPAPDQSFSLSGTRTIVPGPDTKAPQTTIGTFPARLRLKRGKRTVTAKLRFRSSEPGSTFACKVDSAPFRRCTSPKVLRLRKGRHTIRVRATDAAGNRDATPAKVIVKVLAPRRT